MEDQPDLDTARTQVATLMAGELPVIWQPRINQASGTTIHVGTLTGAVLASYHVYEIGAGWRAVYFPSGRTRIADGLPLLADAKQRCEEHAVAMASGAGKSRPFSS